MEAQIELLYRTVLFREPTAEERAYWAEAAENFSLEVVADAIKNSPEAMEVQTVILPIIGLYQGLLGRAPEDAGLEFWAGAISSGALSFQDLIDTFAGSPEFEEVNPGVGDDVTPEELAEIFYQNLLGREPDAEGLKFWTDLLTDGELTPGEFTAEFVNTPETLEHLGDAIRSYVEDAKDGTIDDEGNADLDDDIPPASGEGQEPDGPTPGPGGGGGAPDPLVATVDDAGVLSIASGANATIAITGPMQAVISAHGYRSFALTADTHVTGLSIGAGAVLNVDAALAEGWEIDVSGDGLLNIANVELGDIETDALTPPHINGITFDGGSTDIVGNLMVDGSVEKAFIATWVDLDEFYYGETPLGTSAEANAAFVDLANQYVEYLAAGNGAILDIVQTKVSSVPNFDARQQSFHENVLSNINDDVVFGRFSGDDGNLSEEEDLRSDLAKDFGSRPWTDGRLDKPSSVILQQEATAWDVANGYAIPDSEANLAGRTYIFNKVDGVMEFVASYDTFEGALTAANDGESILVGAGIYAGTFVVEDDVTIQGHGDVVIDGAFDVQSTGVTIRDLTVEDGAHINGSHAGIYVRGDDLSLENLSVTNTGDFGVARGVLTVTDGDIAGLNIEGGTYSGWATGIYLNPGAPGAIIQGATLSGNNVGISVDAPVGTQILGNAIVNNVVEGIGVGPGGDLSTLTIDGNVVTGSDSAIGNWTGEVLHLQSNEIDGNSVDAVFVGTNGDEAVTGTAGADLIVGGAGADLIDLSAGGSDIVAYGAFEDSPGLTFAGLIEDQIIGWNSADDQIDLSAFGDLEFYGNDDDYEFGHSYGIYYNHGFDGNTTVYVGEAQRGSLANDFSVELVGTHDLTEANFVADAVA